ncbi:PKD domain-containing protein, partial [Mariniflexile sp. HNIBRBA6329]|uniref:PKD domain-containing protein n=1 Tax=Mariniflexile sp. HNIBRBA6329 TaxID=3373088 RepID=UPI0037464E90
MKTITNNYLLKTKRQIKYCLYLVIFLFFGITDINAQCTVPNNMTGAQLASFVTANAATCDGTVIIPNGIDIYISSNVTIPSSINRLIIEDGGQIIWTANATLTLAANTAIVIENTTNLGTSNGNGALSTNGPCNNNKRINIGSVEYSACTGGGNVCIIFSEVIAAGGTIQLDPDFGVITGTDNEVCHGPTLIDLELNGFVQGTPTYLWTVKTKPSGSTVTFSPSATVQDPTVTVSQPGTYIFNIAVTVPLSNSCTQTFVTVNSDIEIVFVEGVSGALMATNPGAGGTCNLAVDFTGTSNGGPNTTYQWNFGDGSPVVTSQNPSHTYATAGNYNVSLTITDPDALASCNVAVVNQTVNIIDTPPTITCPPTVNVFIDNGLCTASNVNLGTPTTNDDCSATSITNDAPSVFPVGTTTVTWTVKDASNNSATCQQLVVVTDNQAPVFDCNSLAQIDLNSDSSAVCTNGT